MLGSNSGQFNTGGQIGSMIGFASGQLNTGGQIGAMLGSNSGQYNSGNEIGVFAGGGAGERNTGSFLGGVFGKTAGNRNTGSSIGLISGNYAGEYNTGSDFGVLVGYNTGRYNTGANNIIGNQSHRDFLDNASGIKVASAVDINTEYVTVTNHNFGVTNAYANLRYTTNGTPIDGLSNNGIYKVKIIDANTIYFYLNGLSSAGTGTQSFTPQYQYTNVNIFGNSVSPTKSNQTIMGNSSTTEFIAYGTHLIGTTTNNGVDKLQVNGTISATSYTGGATLTGTPTAPTATAGTNTTQIATTAFVQREKAITVRKISTNTTLADSDNGTIILLTASCTVTLPNGLMSGFNCSFSTLAGATLTYSLGGSVVLLNNLGTTMAEKLSHTIVNTGISNEYLTAGSL